MVNYASNVIELKIHDGKLRHTIVVLEEMRSSDETLRKRDEKVSGFINYSHYTRLD